MKKLKSYVAEYKFKKLSDKAYILQIVESNESEEEDGHHQLQGFLLETNEGDNESESEDELSEGSENSDRASPVPDDTHCESIIYLLLSILIGSMLLHYSCYFKLCYFIIVFEAEDSKCGKLMRLKFWIKMKNINMCRNLDITQIS